jgi:hypothetical protein
MDRAYATANIEEGRVRRQRHLTNGGQELSGTGIGAAATKPLRIASSSSPIELLVAGTAMAGSHSDAARKK